MRLQDQVVVVTGGGHGIGKAYCLGLAGEGALVAVADIDHVAARDVQQQIADRGGRALAIAVDVADEQSTLEMARAVHRTWGKIDVLINNAAVFSTIPISRVPFDQVPLEEWDRVMAVNLRGTFLACRAVVPYMKERRSGKIINISSGSVFSGKGMRIHYVTSKAGLLGFTRTLARELGEYGITVNTLAPGSTLSESPENMQMVRFRQQAIEGRCLRRVQVPEDLVGTVIYLSSADSDFLTGQTIVVDGGNVML